MLFVPCILISVLVVCLKRSRLDWNLARTTGIYPVDSNAIVLPGEKKKKSPSEETGVHYIPLFTHSKQHRIRTQEGQHSDDKEGSSPRPCYPWLCCQRVLGKWKMRKERSQSRMPNSKGKEKARRNKNAKKTQRKSSESVHKLAWGTRDVWWQYL